MWPWSSAAPRVRAATGGGSPCIAVAAVSAGDAASDFTVRVDRSGGQALGIEVIAAGADAIEVKTIKAGGLVEAWNAVHPSEAVRPGDALVCVNGRRGPGLPEAFLAEIRRLEPLELVVSPAASTEPAEAEAERLAAQNRALRAELDTRAAGGEALRRGDVGPEVFSMDASPISCASSATPSHPVEEVFSRLGAEPAYAAPASPRPASPRPAPSSPERLSPGPLPLPLRDPQLGQLTAMSPLPTSPGSSSLSHRLSGSGGSGRSRRRSLPEVHLFTQDRRLAAARPALQRLRVEAEQFLEGCNGLAGEADCPESVAELERLRGLLAAFEQPLSVLLMEVETTLDDAAACGEEASKLLRSTSTPRHSISVATPCSSSAATPSAATPRTEKRRRSSVALEEAEALLLRSKRSSSSCLLSPPMSPSAGLQRTMSSPAGGCLSFDSPAVANRESRQPQEAPDEDIATDDIDSETVLQLAQVAEELTDALEEAQGAEWEARRLLEEASRRLQAEQEANALGDQAEELEMASLRKRLADQEAATEAERERAAGFELEFMRLELQTALAQAKAAELAGKKGFSASWRYKT